MGAPSISPKAALHIKRATESGAACFITKATRAVSPIALKSEGKAESEPSPLLPHPDKDMAEAMQSTETAANTLLKYLFIA